MTRRGNFKTRNTFEKRKALAEKIMAQHPARVPVIMVLPHDNALRAKTKREKFLAPDDILFGKFISEMRMHIDVDPSTALFCFVKSESDGSSHSPSTTNSMAELYMSHSDSDGFLYIYVQPESTFG